MVVLLIFLHKTIYNLKKKSSPQAKIFLLCLTAFGEKTISPQANFSFYEYKEKHTTHFLQIQENPYNTVFTNIKKHILQTFMLTQNHIC